MAKAGMDALTRGLSGMIGRMLVFRRVGNETIVSVAPQGSASRSPAQQAQRSRFREASSYARRQVADPIIKAAYALSVQGCGTRTAYHAALTDFLNAPQVTALDCSGYNGRPGGCIRTCATDDFRVTAVHVQVYTAGGHILEQGAAVQQPSGLEWVYTATVDNMELNGCRIVVQAADLPGNTTVREIML